MAEEQAQVDNPVRATAGTIRQVPGNLMSFLTSRIAEYLGNTEGISAEIHESPGELAKLVLYGVKDTTYLLEQTGKTTDIAEDYAPSTNKILVKNFPSNVDEDILESFFESSKRRGGGPVKNVQLNREKDWAVVEFCESDAVEGVMSRVPIKMMSTVLDIRPYTSLIQGEGHLETLEVRNLPKELTDELLTMHIENAFEAAEMSSAEYKSDDGEDIEDETRSLEKLHKSAEKWKTTKGCIKETITYLQPVQLRMLKMMNYPENVVKQLPDINVEINLERNEIGFEGDVKTVLSGYRILLETISKLSLFKIDNKPEEHLQLYNRKKVIEYINGELEAQSLTCAWEVQGRMIEVCSPAEKIAVCIKLIDESITEIKLPICKEESAMLITQEWEKELEQIHAENDVLLKVFADKNSTIVTLVTTDKNASGVLLRINVFLKSHLTIKSEEFTTPEFFKNLYLFNPMLFKRLVDQIAKELSMYHVTLQPAPNCNYSKYTVSGTREGRELAIKRMTKLDVSF